MRKIIAEIAMSLDGFIEDSKGELDWLLFDEEPHFVNSFLDRFDVIFYGRVAYEKFGIHLVKEETNGSNAETTYMMNQMRKYVFTRSRRHVEGNGMVINRNFRQQVMRIKNEEGKDIWLCGGAGIIRTFAAMDLIDEYLLAVQPIILGTGKSLFANLRKRIHLQLVEVDSLKSGVVLLKYRPTAKKPSPSLRVLRVEQ